jgi:hypothetical protein
MFFSKRHVFAYTLSSAVLVGLLGLAAPLASAAVTPAAKPAPAIASAVGLIDCAGNVCVQTNTVNNSNCTAVVAVWANRNTFEGYFEMRTNGGFYRKSPAQWWYAGKNNWKVTVPFHPNYSYTADGISPPLDNAREGTVVFPIHYPAGSC